ncbi:hypothetical protein Tco_0736637 [Tanacetum coccineum]
MIIATLTPVPPDINKNELFLQQKRQIRHQQGLEFLFSPLLEEYYNPTHGLTEENNNDQASNASVHQDDFFNPFCTRDSALTNSIFRRWIMPGALITEKQHFRRIQFHGDNLVENGIIELYFVRTEYQLADMFTKALPEDRFKYLVRRIGMRCLTPAELEVLTNETA